MDTTIDRIEAWACSLPLPTPLRFGTFEVRTREYAAVRVSTKGGLVADCLSQTRKAPVDVAILDVLAPALIGRDGLDIPPAAPIWPAPCARWSATGSSGAASRCSRCACMI